MSKDSNRTIDRLGRRRVLKQAAAAGATLVVGPYFTGRALAQASAQVSDLAPYQQAKINWRQVEGEQITVAVIPAGYFDNLIAIAPQFEALSGIKVRFEKVPPGQIRQRRCWISRRRQPPTQRTRPTRCTTRCTCRTSGWTRSIAI